MEILNGRINLGDFPVKPSIDQVNAVMALLGKHLGGSWWAVQTKGRHWEITRDKKFMTGIPRSNFVSALVDATGFAVMTERSYKSDDTTNGG